MLKKGVGKQFTPGDYIKKVLIFRETKYIKNQTFKIF